jgi:hypothetical protein
MDGMERDIRGDDGLGTAASLEIDRRMAAHSEIVAAIGGGGGTNRRASGAAPPYGQHTSYVRSDSSFIPSYVRALISAGTREAGPHASPAGRPLFAIGQRLPRCAQHISFAAGGGAGEEPTLCISHAFTDHIY